MKKEDVEYFSGFLEEFQNETDRGAALVGAALIDQRLERLLKFHFIECKESKEVLSGGNAPLGSFSSRIKIAFCLGLITELEYKECDYIRRIRNEFAHKVHGLTFNDNKVHDLCKNLKANNPGSHSARGYFINSVILTSLALWYRPEHNEPNKSKTKDWEWQLSCSSSDLI